ncbi:MAG TPA: Ig-like domain-containing protein [Terriglobia bacterium]|nr:Ig-like domain-containing protein [Terriglobia bacterium]
MERAVTRVLCFGLLLMMVFGPGMDSRAEGATTTLIVKMIQGVSPADAEATIIRHGGTLKSSIAPLRMYVAEVPVEATETIITNLQKDPNVERVEIEQSRKVSAVPTDALYSTQWSLSKIKWDEVYGNVSPIAQVDIAVLDTGIDASHPDLIGAIGPGTSFVDSSQGRTDLNGHGTWVSGIVAGRTNNFDGIAGVAYSNVQILPVKVLNAAGEGQDSDIISGIMWAVDRRASVILMAFSNPGFSQNLQDAIDYAWSEGIVLVAASGNDNSSAPAFPAGDKSVIGVSATDENDLFATGSNYGPAVFMAAPGTNIVSTYKDGGYITWSGTSASAALVAGAAAFMRAVDPSLTNGAVVGRLARNADPAGLQSETGNGRLQIARALADTATDEVRPMGAPPVGDGGPFVGPYRAAARNFDVSFAGTGTGSVTISVSATGQDATNTLTLNGCAGSGDGTSSVTISATCASLHSGNGNDATLIFTASPSAGSTFSGWSGASALNSSTCSGTTNPCSAVLGPNARLTVNFNANTAPTAASGAVSTAEDTPLLITLSGTDTSPASLAFSLVSGPGAGAGSLSAIGTPSCSAGTCTADVTFTPTANYSGPTSFTFKTNDGFLDSTTATISITVNPVNDAPVASNGSFTNAEDGGAVAIDLGALVSDLETSDSNLTYNIVTPPASGALSGTGANKTFTPAANFNGQVLFTYSVTDRGDPDACSGGLPACAAALTSNNATVTITITPVNDTPVANNVSFDGAEDGGAVSIDLAPAVSDQETADASLTYNIVTPPSTGTLTGTGPNFSFTPAANFNGLVTFTYSVTDRGDPDNCTPGAGCAAAATSNTATVTIAISPVNDAPTAANESFTGAEDGGAVAIDLGALVADLETADGNLTYNILTSPASGTLSGIGPNKTFTPPANFNGQVTFTYSVTDGGDPDACSGGLPDCADALTSNTATVTITITPVNDRPTASDSSASIAEDNAAGIGFDLSTLVDDVETDNAFLTYQIVAGPTAAQGTLTGSGSSRTFTPAANFNGTVLITYNVTDRGDPDNCTPGAGCAAAQTSETKTITITVTPVNDAPTAADASFTGAEDGGAVAIDLGALVDDLETADGNLTYNILTSPASGTLSGIGPNRTFTPPANFNGQVTFTYSVTDGGDPDACSGGLPDCADALTSNTATVTITITPVNDRPTASDSSATVAEDNAAGVGFDLSTLVDDVESDNAFLTYQIVAGPTAAQGTLTGSGSSRTFTPAANFNGTVLITYNVTDRGDPDNCTPGAGCAAAQTSETKTITITVTPVNDIPAANDGEFTGDEDTDIAINLAGLVADLETADGNLTYSIESGPTGGTLTPGATPGTYTYRGAENFFGDVTFTYKVTDRGDPDNCGGVSSTCASTANSATKTITIHVSAVNDAALVLDSGDASAQYSDTPAPTVTITATDVDTPGSALTLTSIQVDGGGASGLTATVSTTGDNSRTWTIGGRALLAPGAHTVRVNISDGLINSYVEWTLTVTKEDAGVNYSGVIFFSTSSVSASTGTATLTATVTDDNDGAAIRGDIRKAKVTFMNRDTNLPFAGCVELPVGLVNPANLTVGTATCQTILSTGIQESTTYTVGILVDDHYTRNVGADNELVTIYKPIGTYFITGGGYLSLSSSAGQLAGDVYSKNNFGFNVKYNKTGKNLQGNFNSIVRSDGRVYQIKATSMETLNVNQAAGCPSATASAPCTAVFTSKANMTDITDPLRPVPVAGNLILQVTMTDKGQPGNADSIGISVFNQNGGLLFSSSWNGVQTVEQFLSGGNQVVH